MLLGPIVAVLGHIPFIIASSLPAEYTTTASSDDNHGNKLVFCHFMAWHSTTPHWIVNPVLTLVRLASLAIARVLATMTTI